MNYLARLGHSYSKRFIYLFMNLQIIFHLNNLSVAPSRFDVEQLLYWQKMLWCD